MVCAQQFMATRRKLLRASLGGASVVGAACVVGLSAMFILDACGTRRPRVSWRRLLCAARVPCGPDPSSLWLEDVPQPPQNPGR